MATKTIVEHYCDGCGKQYDPSSVQNYPMDFKVAISWKSWDGTEHNPNAFVCEAELCPDCGSKVMDVLKKIGVRKDYA